MPLGRLTRKVIRAATAPANDGDPKEPPWAARRRWLWLAAPPVLAGGMVLTVYADTGAVLYELPRPLFALVGLATLVELVALAVLRRPAWASVIGIVLVAVLFATRLAVLFTALVVVAAVAYRQQARIRRRPEQPVASTLAIYSVVFCLVAFARVVASGAFEPTDLLRRTADEAIADSPAGPDIYLVLLDAYPRSDTIEDWGYDNGWFEDALEHRGFEVATRSRSSYPATGLILASMLNMRHIEEIPGLQDPPEDHVQQTRAVAAAANESSVLAELEGRGYWTVHAGLTEARGTVRNVDQDIDTGELRLWERQVLQRTRLWPWLCEALVIPQHRSLIRSTFEAIEEVAATARDEPTFMLAHVMSPHVPIVFDDTGQPTTFRAGSCGSQFELYASLIGVSEAAYGAAMSEQIQFINTATLRVVDTVLQSSPEAIVIVFSDHGARFSSEPSDEWFSSFFAARTPAHPGLFPDDARPIEIFPRVFNAYFDMKVAVPDDRMFLPVEGNLPLRMEPYRWKED